MAEFRNLLDDLNFKRLVIKFFKIQKAKTEYNVLYNTLKRNFKDETTFYKQIKNLNFNETEEYNDHEKYSYVVRNYTPILKPFVNPGSVYLDIGCGTGYKAEKLGKDLLCSRVYGVDIENWSLLTKDRKMKIDFEFIRENEKLPFGNDQFDVISVFMVLHHIKNLEFLLGEIKRILKTNGILIIREHDKRNDQDTLLINAEHYLYDYIKIKDFDHTTSDFYAEYKSKKEWEMCLGEFGFENLKDGFDLNFRKQISPSRAFHSIFKLV